MEESAVFNEGTEAVAEQSVTDTPPEEYGTDMADSTAEGNAEATDGTAGAQNSADAIDYEQLIADDVCELKREFPELADLSSLTDLPDVMRYAALRDLGLTATEAYLASCTKGRKRDNRSHLVTAVSRSAGTPKGTMSREELSIARDLFSDMSESQIYELYRKVKK